MYQKRQRQKNEKEVLRFIARTKEFTVQNISKSLGLSFPTAKSIISNLMKEHFVIESVAKQNSGGRRAQLYNFNPNAYYSIGVKIELNYLKLLLINLEYRTIKRIEINRSFVEDENIVDDIIEQLEYFFEDIDNDTREKILGIGISIPGIVDQKSLSIKVGTNFRLYEKDMMKIREVFNLDIFLENEANAGAIAEYYENQRGEFFLEGKNLIFLSINTGIGAGIFINGNFFGGTTHEAGEIGHMIVQAKGKKCNCGGEGCWETYASDTTLLKEFQEKYNEIKNYSDIFRKEYFLQEEGRKILDTYLDYLGIGIRNILMAFNPDKIIIGGQITRYRKHFEDKLQDIIFSNNIFYSNKNIIEFSKHFDDSNLLGASLLPMLHLYHDNFIDYSL